jgi:CorA-like Mg2+ transporter protein
LIADVLHLHTYFLFPFSIDQNAVMEEHPEIWKGGQQWFEKLDRWVTAQSNSEHQPVASRLGGWQRSPQSHFDLRAPAYQDMVFFHPFVRRPFFDAGNTSRDHEALVHRYLIHLEPGGRLLYEAEDIRGACASVEVTDLRLLLFANGISILTLGIEARDISYASALWINEMMRKIYPSSDRQIETARIPSRLALVHELNGQRREVAEERWENSRITGFRPQLSNILLGLLHFADYGNEEFEAVLDERMIVNSFVSLDRTQFPPEYESAEDYDVAFSRFLYVDRSGPGFRYEPQFTREQMKKQVYRRWQHEGTLYGATGYSNVTSVLMSPETSEGDGLVYRMFKTKNHLIALIALFYRASLLDFAKESALVSRQLFPVFSGKVVRHQHIQFATRLMADFHYFNNYWFFDELTTKDEELEHFQLLCNAYRVGPMKDGIEDQIDKLAGYIDRLYALRNSDAVNRLAMISVILGIGALVTGYYGMNIPVLGDVLKSDALSFASIVLTSLMAVASVAFIFYIVGFNWVDYRASLLPHRYRKSLSTNSLRKLRGNESESESSK